MEYETNPLSFSYLDDFTDGMHDPEQKPGEQSKSANQTADDDVQGENADCAGDPIPVRYEPEAHPPQPEREAHTEPQEEVVAHAIGHVDRFEKCRQTQGQQKRKQHFLEKGLHILTRSP